MLLRLSTLLKTYGSEVHLIDALSLAAGSKRLHRSRVAVLDVDGNKVSKWRYGVKAAEFAVRMKLFKDAHWYPEVVYVECGTTYWWQGAAEVIGHVRDVFRDTHIVLVGTYAKLAGAHAKLNARADSIPAENWPELRAVGADLTAYSRMPTHHQITLGTGQRTADAIVSEVETAAKLNVRDIAFSDHRAAATTTDLYVEVLEKLVAKKLGVRLYALGSIAATDVVAQPELAKLMRSAGYVQICFADDRDSSFDSTKHEDAISNYGMAARLCHEAGFRARTEELIASVCVGHLGEDLAERARFITLASHYVGSVIVWPYQPTVEECGTIPLEDQNGKLFPLRNKDLHVYRDYMNLLGLATVFNSKHRSRTFDFLGDSFTARLFQESVARRGWSPSEDVKGSLKLPMIAR